MSHFFNCSKTTAMLYLSLKMLVQTFLTERSKYCFSKSIPINFLPNSNAIIPVVELPVNGSSIKSPLFVDARIMRLNNSKGFWVGCLPKSLFRWFWSSYCPYRTHLFIRLLMKSSPQFPFFITS